MIPITLKQARRLAITKQHLSGEPPKPTSANILSIIRDLGCVQLDPVNVVARSPQLVVFSRVGKHDPRDFESLIFRDKKLFEYWAHCASIVLTEDFPIHNAMMREYLAIVNPRFKPDADTRSRFLTSDSAWTIRARDWVRDNDKLRRAILRRLKREGALSSRAFEEEGIDTKDWVSTGWTSERNVARMLSFLWLSGSIMVAGRDGLNKTWDLAERVLPKWTPREKWAGRDIVRTAAQKSLRALGIATPRQIAFHFIRGRYTNLVQILANLEAEGKIQRVELRDDARNRIKGDWYIHSDDVPILGSVSNGAWEPRTTLLSPSDNLIADRARTRLLFDFDYTIEIYTPKDKRKFGYYVLPVLHGDKLIGRVDPLMDRVNNRLVVNQVYAESSGPKSGAHGRMVGRAIEHLADFLGAEDILYNKKMPRQWR